MYEVRILRAAADEIRKLPASDRVVRRIMALRDDPRPPGVRKLVGSKDAWRIMVGAYRVLYEVDDGVRIVWVSAVRHRRVAYR